MFSIQNELRFKEILGENWEVMCHSAFDLAKVQQSVEVIIQKLFTDIWQSESKIEIKSTGKAYLIKAVKFTDFKHLDEIGRKRELKVQGDDVSYFHQDTGI